MANQEFLQRLDEQAAERAKRARSNRREPGFMSCRVCNGTGTRSKYVLPGVVGPAECIACKGTGAQAR